MMNKIYIICLLWLICGHTVIIFGEAKIITIEQCKERINDIQNGKIESMSLSQWLTHNESQILPTGQIQAVIDISIDKLFFDVQELQNKLFWAIWPQINTCDSMQLSTLKQTITERYAHGNKIENIIKEIDKEQSIIQEISQLTTYILAKIASKEDYKIDTYKQALNTLFTQHVYYKQRLIYILKLLDALLLDKHD